MKFVISGYKPQTPDGDREAKAFPETEQDYSNRMRDIGNGVFKTVLKEVGPLRRFGETPDPEFFDR